MLSTFETDRKNTLSAATQMPERRRQTENAPVAWCNTARGPDRRFSEAIAALDEVVRLAFPTLLWLDGADDANRRLALERVPGIAHALGLVFQITSCLLSQDRLARLEVFPTFHPGSGPERYRIEHAVLYLQQALTFVLAYRRVLARQIALDTE